MNDSQSFSVESCFEGGKLCTSSVWETLLLTVCTISIVLNSIHIIILTRIKQLRGTAYLVILQHSAVSDLFTAIFHLVRMTCVLRRVIIQQQIYAILVVSFADAFVFSRFTIVLIACIERAVALHNPLHYESFWLIKQMNPSMFVHWFLVATIVTIRAAMLHEHVCFHEAVGIMFAFSTNGDKFVTIPSFGCMVLTVISLTKIFYELWKIKSRSPTQELRTVSAAAKVITILTLTFFLTLLPLAIGAIAINFSSTVLMSLSISQGLGVILYGILNTILFGFMTEGYRKVFSGFKRKLMMKGLVMPMSF